MTTEVLRAFDEAIFEEVSGRDWSFTAIFTDTTSGDPVDLTGVDVSITVKTKWGSGGTAPFTMTLGDGFTIPEPLSGQVVVRKRLTGVPVGTYVYDLSLEEGGEKLSRIRGTLRVLGGS